MFRTPHSVRRISEDISRRTLCCVVLPVFPIDSVRFKTVYSHATLQFISPSGWCCIGSDKPNERRRTLDEVDREMRIVDRNVTYRLYTVLSFFMCLWAPFEP